MAVLISGLYIRHLHYIYFYIFVYVFVQKILSRGISWPFSDYLKVNALVTGNGGKAQVDSNQSPCNTST